MNKMPPLQDGLVRYAKQYNNLYIENNFILDAISFDNDYTEPGLITAISISLQGESCNINTFLHDAIVRLRHRDRTLWDAPIIYFFKDNLFYAKGKHYVSVRFFTPVRKNGRCIEFPGTVLLREYDLFLRGSKEDQTKIEIFYKSPEKLPEFLIRDSAFSIRMVVVTIPHYIFCDFLLPKSLYVEENP